MEIKINVPENCEPAMVTVVYKFHRGIAELASEDKEFIDSRPLPTTETLGNVRTWSCSKCHEEFGSKRICGQHERHCGKDKRATKLSRWTPEQVAYLMEHWDKKGDHSTVVRHLGFTVKKCSDKYGQEIRRAKPDEATKAADESIKAVDETTQDELMQEKKSPWRGSVEKINQLFSKKEFQVPADFNPSKPFGVNSYVYHAPGREMGKVVTVDMQSKTALVDFNGTAKKFTLDAAKAMHKEMLVRAK